MLQKLLKYDLKHMFRYWWILALTSVGVSAIGGVSIGFLEENYTSDNFLVGIFSVLGIIVMVVGLCAFLIGTSFFIYERVYRNFFTDEAYLTFTLPVKRSQLLNSKLIASFLTIQATLLVFIFDAFVVLFTSSLLPVMAESFIQSEFVASFLGLDITERIFAVIILAFFVLLVLIVFWIYCVITDLLVYLCITFAGAITQKNRLLAAVGIYYGGSIVFGFAGQIFSMIAVGSVGSIISVFPEELVFIAVIALYIIVLGLSLAVLLALYALELWLLNKKLNLA